jgi:hypothetical protein
MATRFVTVTVFYAPTQRLLSAEQVVAVPVPVECILSRAAKVSKFRLDLATPVWPGDPPGADGPSLPLLASGKKAFRTALRAGLEAHLGSAMVPFGDDVVDWEGQPATGGKSPSRHPWKEDFGKG